MDRKCGLAGSQAAKMHRMSGYSTREVSDLIGMKPDQVRHYVRRALIDPDRTETGEYRFNFQDVVLLRTAKGLLDANVYSKSDVADLFRQRWAIETNLAHLKITMKMDVLKCQTVEGVLRELQVFALVYNMVRQVMLEAASRQHVDVGRIRFVDSLRWLQNPTRDDSFADLVVNPRRPNRIEPRERKRRPKAYKLMTKPRRQLRKDLILQ